MRRLTLILFISLITLSNNSYLQNLNRVHIRNTNNGFNFGSWSNFYSFDEVIIELDSMRMMYPHLITTRDSIGSTIVNRAIWAVKISDNPDVNEAEPEIFYNSLIHGVEPLSMAVLMYYIYYLLENYGIPTGSSVIEFASGKASIQFVMPPDGEAIIEARNQDFKGSYIKLGPIKAH